MKKPISGKTIRTVTILLSVLAGIFLLALSLTEQPVTERLLGCGAVLCIGAAFGVQSFKEK